MENVQTVFSVDEAEVFVEVEFVVDFDVFVFDFVFFVFFVFIFFVFVFFELENFVVFFTKFFQIRQIIFVVQQIKFFVCAAVAVFSVDVVEQVVVVVAVSEEVAFLVGNFL